MARVRGRGCYSTKRELSESKYVSNPIGLLAAQIVVYAVNDWRDLIKAKAWLDERTTKKHCNFYELRKFFRSDWCAFLMQDMDNIEPSRLLAILEAELDEAKAKYERERKKGK